MRKIILTCLSLSCLGADNIRMNYYHFEDLGENEVNTSGFHVLKTIWPTTAVVFDAELDQVRSAPILDGQSGATRPAIRKTETLEKNRGQFIIGLSQEIGKNHTLGFNSYWSREIDYKSTSLSTSWASKWFQENLVVTLMSQYNQDRVGNLKENYEFEEYGKELWVLKGKVSQLLSKSAIYTLQGDYSLNKGYLSDPYRKITLISGEVVEEKVPEIRKRYSVGQTIKWGIEKAAFSIELHHRYYWDRWGEENAWGVSSNTYRIVLAKKLGNYLLLDISYRNYAQQAAYFWQESYTGNEVYRTADYKLSEFDSQNFGFGVDWNLGVFGSQPAFSFFHDWNITLDYFHYLNSLEFTANIYEVGLEIKF